MLDANLQNVHLTKDMPHIHDFHCQWCDFDCTMKGCCIRVTLIVVCLVGFFFKDNTHAHARRTNWTSSPIWLCRCKQNPMPDRAFKIVISVLNLDRYLPKLVCPISVELTYWPKPSMLLQARGVAGTVLLPAEVLSGKVKYWKLLWMRNTKKRIGCANVGFSFILSILLTTTNVKITFAFLRIYF